MKEPAFRQEYEALEGEFSLIAAVAKARARAGLSQAELAKRRRRAPSRRWKAAAAGRRPARA